ncbi:MAG: hypothetical protein K0R48_1167 [Gammaproteobacteria bacterium]|jgi:hypothetical protein|nr:hypothetical protein [Gammaproteobacteria bacterium]
MSSSNSVAKVMTEETVTLATPLLNNTGMSTGDKVAASMLICCGGAFFGGTLGSVAGLLVKGPSVSLGSWIAGGAAFGTAGAGIGLVQGKIKGSCAEATEANSVSLGK